ncbi:amidohydrolase [Micrococcales bacterium 31B]|nr:amidohydrolase [Micrococcales bacterium 31B]
MSTPANAGKATQAADRASGQTPDLILTAAAVLTGEPDQRETPTTLAITGERISALGGAELLATAGPHTRIVELPGHTVLPGINDGHLHLVGHAMSNYGHLKVGAAEAATWGEVAALLAAAPVPSDGWLRAHGWDAVTLGPGGEAALAHCRDDIPVVAYDQTGHQLIANAVALDRAGITAATADPAGGVIGRDADGTPTGLLQDAATLLINRALPDVPRDTLRDALLRAQADLHAQGITSLTEPGLGPGSPGLFDGSCSEGALRLLGDLAAADELSLRITVLMLFAGTGGISADLVRAGLASGLDRAYSERGIDPLRLRIAGVKVFSDGIPRSNTAWMHDPYGPECTHGHLVVAGETDEERLAELRELLTLIDAAGLQAGIHSTGDASSEACVEILSGLPAADRRHYLIHGAFSGPETLERMGEHGIGLSTNPLLRSIAGDLMRDLMGAERFAFLQPLKAGLDARVPVNIASDAPVTSTDWRETIIAAVRRHTPSTPGDPADPQRLTPLEALAAMTSLPAWQDHADTDKGRLLPGYLADLCVLDGEYPTAENIETLRDLRVVLTLVGGRAVHESALEPSP